MPYIQINVYYCIYLFNFADLFILCHLIAWYLVIININNIVYLIQSTPHS